MVGMGDDPTIGEYERLLLSTKTTARKELVLLHPQRYVVPGSTREWLKVRNAPTPNILCETNVSLDSPLDAFSLPRRDACKSYHLVTLKSRRF